MKITPPLLLIAGLAMGLFFIHSCSSNEDVPRILLFAKSEFYYHECNPIALEALSKLCEDNGWAVDVTDDAWEYFTKKQLPQYAAVVFFNTAGDVLSHTQEALFEQYIKAGGGFMGIHNAIDTEHRWEWYGQLVGGRFGGMAKEQMATLLVHDQNHPATQHLDSIWTHTDEWFNLTELSPDINVVLKVDESSYEGGTMGAMHPISWHHEFDGGRTFFTALGHTPDSYTDPDFLQHLSEGLKYAVGNNKAPLQFKKRRTTGPKTVTTGFVRTQLACNLHEPMELDMFPDGRILIAERRGALKRYDPLTNSLDVVGELDVFLESEEGLLGLAIDPNWEENHWIYLYYAPAERSNGIRLSRFVFPGDKILYESEQILLEVKTEHGSNHYHASGCVEMDAKGFLYLSTGDNSHHHPPGYTSVDERPGFSYYDAQRSSANTMDLRGKILRIKPLADGSYLCPADNLFTGEVVRMKNGKRVFDSDFVWEGVQTFVPRLVVENRVKESLHQSQKEKPWYGLPEIYIMGVRNPFRFDIDDRTGLLSWCDPGPDSSVDNDTLGPMGYDEFNIAREAGNYGWPYLIADNKPFAEYDLVADTVRDFFDPDNLINDSPHNTGATHLPPARPAIIWYPFQNSEEFPIVNNGTRCGMGGPIYHCDEYPPETRFPDRYDGQLIIYEWMRHWILSYGIDSLDRLNCIQPIASNIRFARPMDMLIDKNGSLWVLEYGTDWYSQNKDACLSRVDYIRGEEGEEPLLVEGVNNPPTVRWDLRGNNQSFYKPGDQLRYSVVVSDPEDGSLADQRITSDMVDISIEYVEKVKQPGLLAATYQPVTDTPEAKGKTLINNSNCKSCHALERTVKGPSFKDIAEYYGGDKSAIKDLSVKIIEGGAGVWGEDLFMTEHPDISLNEASNMVAWIFSIIDPENYPLPTVGHYTLKLPESTTSDGAFVFHARYKDIGGEDLESHTGSHTLVLRSPTQPAAYADSLSEDIQMENGHCYVGHGSVIVFRNIDLWGVQSVDISLGAPIEAGTASECRIEMRIGNPNGRLAGKVALPDENTAAGTELTLEVDRSTWPTNKALFDLYFVVIDESRTPGSLAALDWLRFNL